MTKLLDQAIAKAKSLPSERQDEAAEVLLSILEQEPGTLQLSQEQLDKDGTKGGPSRPPPPPCLVLEEGSGPS